MDWSDDGLAGTGIVRRPGEETVEFERVGLVFLVTLTSGEDRGESKANVSLRKF